MESESNQLPSSRNSFTSSSSYYYLSVFQMIFKRVILQDYILFSQKERETLKEFNEILSTEEQSLFLRLFMRKSSWILIKNISYEEFNDTPSLLNSLITRYYLNENSGIDELNELLSLLSLSGLVSLSKEFNLLDKGKSNRKSELIALLIKHSLSKSIFSSTTLYSKILKSAKAKCDPCVKVNPSLRSLFSRIVRLFNLQRWWESRNTPGTSSEPLFSFYLQHFSSPFPEYTLQKSEPRIFRHRQDYLDFDKNVVLLDELIEKSSSTFIEPSFLRSSMDFAAKELEKIKSNDDLQRHSCNLPSFLRKFTPGSMLAAILNFGVELSEKSRNYSLAVSLLKILLYSNDGYLLEYRGHWFDRLTLDLEQHLSNPNEALVEIGNALQDPGIRPSRKMTLEQRIQKIMKLKKNSKIIMPSSLSHYTLTSIETPTETIKGQMLTKEAHKTGKSVFIYRGDGESRIGSVEDYVLHYFESEFPRGLHDEGSGILSMVLILFWDIVYSDVQNAFLFPYQSAPLDLNYSEFYESRKHLIEERLDFLFDDSDDDDSNDDKFTDFLKEQWKSHSLFQETSVVTPNVFSSFEDFNSLRLCFKPFQLKALSHKIMSNYRNSRSGFPDLTLWNPKEKRLRIIEVKGPKDKLSTKQILWIDFLKSIQINVVALYVEASAFKEPSSKKLRSS